MLPDLVHGLEGMATDGADLVEFAAGPRPALFANGRSPTKDFRKPRTRGSFYELLRVWSRMQLYETS